MKVELHSKAVENPWRQSAFKSIYFGGGTPSILSPKELGSLLETIYQLYVIEDDVEITMEANPDDISSEHLKEWSAIGVNRLSLGIQSFFDDDLKLMNRAHSSRQAHEALSQIAESDISNLSVDMIYGLPNSTLQKWTDNLYMLDPYPVQHLSGYALTVEVKTALKHLVDKGKVTLPSDDSIVEQFQNLRTWTYNRGFEHYELSNFALPGFRSKHNSHYWTGQNYLGIGPGAHSFCDNVRWWNVSNNTQYANGKAPESEELNQLDRINEKLMTKLRTAEGFNWDEDFPKGLDPLRTQLFENVKKGVHQGVLFPKPLGFSIRPEHWMQSDKIISDLFILAEDENH